jgi:hypothetical protein
LLSTLGPLIRRRIGTERQAMLASMVQMGLQRVVVDEGRLHASMDMRVDTRSALEQERAQRQELNIDTGASAQVGMGMWGASAHLNVGYNRIESEHNATREEIDTRAGLRSSVDLAFRTDQIPLDKMASRTQRARLDANARVPASVADGSGSILSNQPMGSLPSMDQRVTAGDRDANAAQQARTDARTERQRSEDQQREDRNRQEANAREDRNRNTANAREDQRRREDQAREDRNRPAGTNTAGTNTAGTNTAGTNTAGTNTAGTNTAGTNTAGTNTAGTNTAATH